MATTGHRRRRRQGVEDPVDLKKRVRKEPLDLAANHDYDDHIDSEDDDDDYERRRRNDADDEEEDDEALEVKKVRLAREYLQSMKDGEEDDDDDNDDDEEEDEEEDGDSDDDQDQALARKLQHQRLKRAGALERDMADQMSTWLDRLHAQAKTSPAPQHAAVSAAAAPSVEDPEVESRAWVSSGLLQLRRGHDLTCTAVALQADGSRAVSGSKDHSVLLWDVNRATRLQTIALPWSSATSSSTKTTTGAKSKGKPVSSRTMGQVLAVSCTDDGRYTAVGRRNGMVQIFDVRQASGTTAATPVQEFVGAKGPITSLTFRTQSYQLFAGSDDRCVRHYNLQEMMYVETLYGHQFGVTGMDCHVQELPISVGADRTARAWKLSQDSHLIFRGGSRLAAPEAVSIIKDDWFLTGHQDGHLALWRADKKRAVAMHPCAHGTTASSTSSDTATSAMTGPSVVSVGCVRGSDVALTGSNDGYLRLWKVQTGRSKDEARGIESLGQIPVHGYVNDIAVGPQARFAVAAVGQEHRLGRWNPVRRAKNRLAIIRLHPSDHGFNKDDPVEEIDLPPKDEEGSEDHSSDSDSSDSDQDSQG